MSQTTAGLKLKNMTFYFNQSEQPFFEDVTLHFPVGEIHFIRGHNGSGKSTLLRILKGAIEPSEKVDGTVVFDNKEYTFAHNTLNQAYTASVKSVVQNVNSMVADAFTVEENLQLANVPIYPALRPLPRATLIRSILDNVTISLSQRVSDLSGGQRQLLAVMMMLQKTTKILLLDEPTAALDNKNARMVLNCLQNLASQLGLTVIIISHDKELVEMYAKKYLEIEVDAQGKRHIHMVTH